MKTRFFIVLAAMGLLASCSKEKEIIPASSSEPVVLQVGIAPVTKTHMGGLEGDQRKIYWSDGDQIAINGQASDALGNLEEGTQTASFSFADAPAVPYKVLYPASAYVNENIISLPDIQKWEEGSFADDVVPMAGYSADGSNITVGYLCAVLKISVRRAASDPDEDNLLGVRFRGKNGEQVKGRFGIDYTTGQLSGASNSEDDKEVKVYHTLSTETPAVYYITVPAGTYAKGFEVVVQDVNNHIMTMTRNGSVNLVAGTIYNLAEFAYAPTGTETGIEIDSAEKLIAFATAYNNKEYASQGEHLLATLTADISFDATSSAAFNATGGIGTSADVNRFDGTFNGNNKTVSGLASTVPLFGGTTSSSVIKDITLDNTCSFTFTNPNSGNFEKGAIVGYHRGTLSNVKVAAAVSLASVSDVTTLTALGGLVGRIVVGRIEDGCEYSGLISTPAGYASTAKLFVGGLAGEITNVAGSISDSNFKGGIGSEAQITSTDKTNPYVVIGGIVGYLSAGSVTDCTTTSDGASVPAAGSYSSTLSSIVLKTTVAYNSAVGGISGENVAGTVSGCTNGATIFNTVFKVGADGSRYMKVGGIVGKNGANGTITGCTNNATVQHRSNPRLQDLGGIAGYNAGAISSCTNNAAINHMTSGQSVKSGRVVALGGVIGENVTGATVSDVHNTANIEISSMEDGTSSDVRLGGVIGLNQAAIDGGSSKNITNSGRVYFSPNMSKQFLGYEIGGIVGQSEASVENAKNTGYVYFRWNSTTNVASKVYLGGIVGKMAGNGTIGGCVNEGGSSNAGEIYPNVASGDAGHNNIFAGGILGYSESNVIISECINSGYVHGGNGTRKAATSFYTGGIVAYLKGTSSILNCTNTGQVNNIHSNNTDTIGSTPLTGGIVAYAEGTNENPITIGGTTGCSVDATLAGTRGWIAGIAAYAKYVNINHCNVEQDINCAARAIGGLVGKAEYCTIASSAFNGSKLHANNTQKSTGQGGLIGNMADTIVDGCSTYVVTLTNNLTGEDIPNVGSIVGYSTGENNIIKNCHYKSSITTTGDVVANIAGYGTYTDGGGNAADL